MYVRHEIKRDKSRVKLLRMLTLYRTSTSWIIFDERDVYNTTGVYDMARGNENTYHSAIRFHHLYPNAMAIYCQTAQKYQNTAQWS